MNCHDRQIEPYLVVSTFEPTLALTPCGLTLSKQVEIPCAVFEEKIATLREQNLLQPGGELTYLLLHDLNYRSRVRKMHLRQAGKKVALRKNIRRFASLLGGLIDMFRFDFHVISATPQELVASALEDIIPADSIHSTIILDIDGTITADARTEISPGIFRAIQSLACRNVV